MKLAAAQNHARACFALGEAYAASVDDGIRLDLQEALKYFRKAARAGHADARRGPRSWTTCSARPRPRGRRRRFLMIDDAARMMRRGGGGARGARRAHGLEGPRRRGSTAARSARRRRRSGRSGCRRRSSASVVSVVVGCWCCVSNPNWPRKRSSEAARAKRIKVARAVKSKEDRGSEVRKNRLATTSSSEASVWRRAAFFERKPKISPYF